MDYENYIAESTRIVCRLLLSPKIVNQAEAKDSWRSNSLSTIVSLLMMKMKMEMEMEMEMEMKMEIDER